MLSVNACEPEVALLPDQDPEAVQLVALVVDQVSVLEPPAVTEVGLADIRTTGAGLELTVTVFDAELLPPSPLQVSV